MSGPVSPDPVSRPNEANLAKGRFFRLMLLRLGGSIATFLGLFLYAGRIPGIPLTVHVPLGLLLVVLGLGTALVLPRYLARKWRSPRP